MHVLVEYRYFNFINYLLAKSASKLFVRFKIQHSKIFQILLFSEYLIFMNGKPSKIIISQYQLMFKRRQIEYNAMVFISVIGGLGGLVPSISKLAPPIEITIKMKNKNAIIST